MAGYGAIDWNDTSIRYSQENNIIESFLGKLKGSGEATFKLESCNVESIGCAVEAIRAQWTEDKPMWMGYGDLIFYYLNSPQIASELPDNSATFPNNEVIANLAYAVPRFSDAIAILVRFDKPEDAASSIKRSLKNGSAVVLSYTTQYNTGHFITIVYWDIDKNRFIGYDPWTNNPDCKNGGVLEEYTEDFIIRKIRHNTFIEIGVSADVE